MAGLVHPSLVRTLLSSQSKNRAFSSVASKSILANSSPLRFAASSSPVLAALSSRRAFSSTPAAAGWIPSFQWNKAPVAPITSEQEQVSAVAPTSSSVADAPSTLPEPAPLSDFVADSAATTVTTTPEVTDSVITHAIKGANDILINTGTLDLTSLASSWGLHPIMRLQSMFLNLHESFPLLGHGLPWYILIPTVTVALRFLLFGFQVRAQANGARMANIQPQMLKGMETLKAAKARGDFVGAQAAQMATAKLMSDHKVNPLKNLIFPLAQASVFMTMFFAIRGLADAGLVSMSTEGMAWVPDLSASDPYYILPVASTAFTLASLEVGVDTTTQVQTNTTRNMKLAFRVGLLVALPFIAYFPAALLLYWVTNNALSLVQGLLLKQPAVRSLFGIPQVKPKAQPGEPGYVAEPSFSEAFKSMQVGAQEKWEETKETTEKEHRRKQQWAKKGANAPAATGYVPRAATSDKKVGELERVSREYSQLTEAEVLVEDIQAGAKGGPIEAAPLSAEAEKARRLFEARQRRMKK